MTDPQRVLVTGARGFLGTHVVARARVRRLDAVAAYRGATATGAVAMDVCDTEGVMAAFRASMPSVVVHCAAYGVDYSQQDPIRALEINIQGALCVLNAAARSGVHRFVHVGSAVEYGSRSGLIAEDAPLNPTALYGATKAAATILLRERARALGVPLLIVRPFGIWGPGEGLHHLVPQVVAACATRTPLRLTSCEVIRDYTYVEDMADAILALAVSDRQDIDSIVNLGMGEGVILRDFVLAIAKVLNGTHLMQFGALPYRPTEMQSLVADVTRARRLLGRRSSTPLHEGVQRMRAGAEAISARRVG